MVTQNRDGPFEAVVQDIVRSGKHGDYAVANVKGSVIKTVTFSLSPPVWEEVRYPEPGTIVMLADVWKKRAGWRAESARYYRPSDEQ